MGGPNVHIFSLWTWVIALVMTITDSPRATFICLHSIIFAVNALAISVLVSTLYVEGVSRFLAYGSGSLLLLTPLVLVQIGYMYTESLTAAFCIFAYSSWLKNQETRAVLYSLIAVSIKLTGIAAVICIAFMLFLRIVDNPTRKRTILFLLIPLYYIIFTSLDGFMGGIAQDHGRSWGVSSNLYDRLVMRTMAIPDVVLFLGAGLISSCILILKPSWSFFQTDFRNWLHTLRLSEQKYYFICLYLFLFTCAIAISPPAGDSIFAAIRITHDSLFNNCDRVFGSSVPTPKNISLSVFIFIDDELV
jgi:hypothetical protein